ncbi:glycosyltransferase [Kaistella anthropi]|nr:glycosyltransferase [Kaistella anthropi]
MSIDLPKVSVVTITYGHEKYITETLDGVLMQQYDGHLWNLSSQTIILRMQQMRL